MYSILGSWGSQLQSSPGNKWMSQVTHLAAIKAEATTAPLAAASGGAAEEQVSCRHLSGPVFTPPNDNCKQLSSCNK